MAPDKIDIGQLKGLRILCISETGWRDTPTLLGDMRAAGRDFDQYDLPWPPRGDLHPENAAGSSALVEARQLDGRCRRFLFDTGWSQSWMDRRFAEEGVDEMLARGDVEALVISHEHFDHFWGIQSTLRHQPSLTIYVPEGFREEGFAFIAEAGHTGVVEVIRPSEPVVLAPGLAVVAFPMETSGRVRGENVLYARVRGRGMNMMTGCGHGGVLELLGYARDHLEGGETVHSVYGGLHLSPFEDWDERREAIVASLAEVGIQRVGCNHCTGIRAVERMLEAGMPVVRGTARNGSRTDLYLGNGDALEVQGT